MDAKVTGGEDYIHIEMSDVLVDKETSREILMLVSDALRKHGGSRILIEAGRPEKDLTLSDIFFLGMDFEKALRGMSIAFVVDASTIGPEEEHFETVASNRGIWIKFFQDVQSAKQWLAANRAKG